MKSLLLVEDDPTLGKNLRERLRNRSFDVCWVQSGEDAKEQVLEHHFDIAVIDIGLPQDDGFTVARVIRDSDRPFPFVFLTAMSSAEFRLEAFELGAADYIPKPFHLRELYLRLERIVGKAKQRTQLEGPDFTLNSEEMTFRNRSGETKRLSARDFQLLWKIIQDSPKVVSRQQILSEIWQAGESASNRSIDNAISRIRQLLSPESSRSLRSYRGIGYFWESPQS